MYIYGGFGLTIAAPIILPELLPVEQNGNSTRDIDITFGTVDPRPQFEGDSDRGIWVHGNQACYEVRGVGAFLVTSGRNILVELFEGASEEAVRLCLLGPVMGLALHQRGLFNLHASAVSIAGNAVAFLGGHGWGKSTMAAMLQSLGHTVISDDLAALDPNSRKVFPSFPQLKLWPDAVDALGHTADGLPLVHPDAEKRALRFRELFASEAPRLRRLYLLAVGPTTEIVKLPPKQAFEEVMRHWYGSRFGPKFLRNIDLRTHFSQVSRLVRDVPLLRLQRPASLVDDPNLAASIEKAILEDLDS